MISYKAIESVFDYPTEVATAWSKGSSLVWNYERFVSRVTLKLNLSFFTHFHPFNMWVSTQESHVFISTEQVAHGALHLEQVKPASEIWDWIYPKEH